MYCNMTYSFVCISVNEEKPALSDNANSLKFSGEANPDGLRDLLFNTKKSHILQDGTSASSGKQLSRLNAHEHQFNNGMARQGDFLSAPVADNLSGGGRVGGSQGSITNNDDRLAQHISTPLNYKLDYTPQDIAEYIFWTRDERGVAMAIGDFLQEGLVRLSGFILQMSCYYFQYNLDIDVFIKPNNHLYLTVISIRDLVRLEPAVVQ
jgi:hypothetical protein